MVVAILINSLSLSLEEALSQEVVSVYRPVMKLLGDFALRCVCVQREVIGVLWGVGLWQDYPNFPGWVWMESAVLSLYMFEITVRLRRHGTRPRRAGAGHGCLCLHCLLASADRFFYEPGHSKWVWYSAEYVPAWPLRPDTLIGKDLVHCSGCHAELVGVERRNWLDLAIVVARLLVFSLP